MDLDASPGCEDLADKYLGEGDGEEENHSDDHVTPDAPVTPELKEEQPDDKTPEPAEPVFTLLFPTVINP